jgi:hypothetical protein
MFNRGASQRGLASVVKSCHNQIDRYPAVAKGVANSAAHFNGAPGTAILKFESYAHHSGAKPTGSGVWPARAAELRS